MFVDTGVGPDAGGAGEEFVPWSACTCTKRNALRDMGLDGTGIGVSVHWRR